MNPDVSEYLKFFSALLAIINPLGAIPMFLSLTAEQTDVQRRRIARITSFSVAILLIVSALLGTRILAMFGISIASFRVGGGILILLMAIAMLQAKQPSSKHTPAEAEEAMNKESIAVVPLAIPLLAGPGSISTVIIYATRFHQWPSFLWLLATILVVALITWLAMLVAIPVSRVVGQTGMNVATRIMGLLLVAIAVEFITGGLLQLLPGLNARP
jgi:multiple antibiotic resistance protein